MNILSYLQSLFSPVGTKTGALMESPQMIATLPKSELFAGGAGTTADWRPFAPKFRWQGASMWCTAFAGASIASIFESSENKRNVVLSPLELFYRSGGGLYGNYLSAVATAMEKAVVLDSDVPTPVPNTWGTGPLEEYRRQSAASLEALKRGEAFKIKQATAVRADTDSLRAALTMSPLGLVVNVGRDYFNRVMSPRNEGSSSLHNVVLLHIDDYGRYITLDSLTGYTGFDGLRTLAPDFNIQFAMGYQDLPSNWVEIQTNAQVQEYPGALQQYGKRRDLKLEIAASVSFSGTIKKHSTLASSIGRNWLVVVNALAYGGYSEQDLLNHFTNIRRTGKPIFDLNHLRR